MKASKAIAILTSVLLMTAVATQPAKAFQEDGGWLPCSEGGRFMWFSSGDQFYLMDIENCKGTAVMPEGLKDLGQIFGRSGLTHIVLTGVTRIQEGVFFQTPMTQFDIPDQITLVKDKAFDGSNLETISISAGATGIAPTAFRGASKLKEVNVAENNPNFTSVGGVLFDKEMKTLLHYPGGKTDTSYTIPSTVTKIGAFAFERQSSLVELSIPTTLIEVAEGAFAYASSLKKYSVPASATIGKEAFRATGVTPNDRKIKCSKGGEVTLKGDIINLVRPAQWWGDRRPTAAENAQWEASNCNGSLTIPAGIYEIPEGAFAGTRLSTLVLPKTMRVVGEFAFESSRLISVTIPEGLTTLSNAMFTQSEKLKTVKLPNTLTSIQSAAFYATGLEEITIPKSVQSIGEKAFAYSNLKKISIPTGIKTISIGLFGYATSLESVSLPNTVETIGSGAFFRTALKTISLPSGLKEIGDRSFAGLIASPVIAVPSSVTKISARSFEVPARNKLDDKLTIGTPKVFFLGNAPVVDGTYTKPFTVYIQKGAKGFNLDPKTKLWHGFTIAYGTPPKVSK